MKRLPGLFVWAAALAAAWLLPGRLWHGAQPPPFPTQAVLPTLLALASLCALPLSAVWIFGPGLARRRLLGALESPPDVVWGLLLLALWPASAGPPGWAAWTVALLAAAVPGELRWLASTLPPEAPFPTAWGARAARASRAAALRRLAPRWIAARLPVWITASLIVERLFGLPGLGGDWMARLSQRDHAGLALWTCAFALLWLAAQPLERPAS